MDNSSLIRVICKDFLIQKHGHLLLKWSLPAWESSVDSLVLMFEALPDTSRAELMERYQS